MAIWKKLGVRGDLAPAAQKGFGKVAKLYGDHDLDLYVTSIREGNHMPGSFHYIGLAFDFRINGVPIEAVRGVLGSDWDVLPSANGTFHCEFDELG